MSSAPLLRYNFRVLMFGNWWLLVFPVAASQLTVFWSLVTQRPEPNLPAQTAEMVTPIVAAFLSAHVLSAEYPARVGAILASKPLNIARIVLLRLMVVLALVWCLEGLSLAAFTMGMGPYNVRMTALASIPSTLFLALLALTFSSLFRQPLAGFGVAALYWAFDLPPGPAMNPYLSLRAYSASVPLSAIPVDGLAQMWWISKLLLLAAAIGLYLFHAQLVFRLGVAPTPRQRRRALGWVGGLAAAYLVTGACVKVGYGYVHAGVLAPSDGAWYRQQFASFGPIPAAYLFGPSFRRYLGDVPSTWRIGSEGEEDLLGRTPTHIRDLRAILDHAPTSIWAPAAAEMLVRMIGANQPTTEARVALCRRIVDGYPHSAYVAFALDRIGQIYDAAGRTADAAAAYAELLRRRPHSVYQSRALRYLVQTARNNGDRKSAERWAQEWVRVAPLQESAIAHVTLAEILRDRGDVAGARRRAHDALSAAKAFFAAKVTGQLPGTGTDQLKWQRETESARDRALRL